MEMGQQLDRETVLVVDDEESLRDICQDALEDAGYKVIQAKQGREALQVLYGDTEMVDLVVSDLRMPELNGMELLQRIRQEQIDVDFLIMTGYGTIETAVESMKLGAADYLPKPFNISHLLLKVEKVLQERRDRKERHNLSNLVRLLKLSRDINSQLDLPSLLKEFLFHLERNFAPQGVGLFLKNDAGELELKTESGGLWREDPRVLSLCRRLALHVLDAREPKLADKYLLRVDTELKGVWNEDVLPYSIMAAPLLTQQGPTGVVTLLRDGQDTNLYTLDDLQLLTVFASQTSSSIVNAKLYGRMRQMNLEVIRSYAQAVEAKDIYTRGHSDRVAQYAVELGQVIGLGREELDQLHTAGLLHDIGKIGIPDRILNKPSGLTSDEYGVMKRHPEVGYSILSQVGTLQEVLPIIFHHHERVDGQGYPNGLSGDEIPFLARLVSVVDSYEAMTSDRAYRNSLSQEKVVSILEQNAGSQWDEELVQHWLRYLSNGNGNGIA
ncbi:HD domain-containing phosphohydrolase [Desulfohalobium retbaense]|uniref:Response regulator receiver modulated metal dependent phosphohydrolase n=1 Tax=Desulfohalobium retbaense (strain ATCC 49708 / DSM 5692 / JCM 16813 / HR100) TaxID=485915 RepID=C8X181_DESRD|nr:HD domain-containing phosphohydrolase [Desulfohalobium retbaense]ACV68178.1 response regulator receiver modulated metal dependent phosphohydrolase [Desulfohalobium retbaense DSM 5692]